MSENKKSVFLSKESIRIIGPFSSGRLNSIIEKFDEIIKEQKIEFFFDKKELYLIFNACKSIAVNEKSKWQSLKRDEIIKKIKENNSENFLIIDKLLKLNITQEVSLIETIERYWAEERVRLFNEYRESKKKQ